MKNCPNCGNQMPNEAILCPHCGSQVNSNYQAPQSNGQTSASRPRLQNRNIVTAIILSLITCGIYGIIWFIGIVNDVNKVSNDDKSNQSGGVVFLLSLITCGIYGFYWFYNAGKRLNSVGNKYGMQISDNSILYLVLNLLGLGVVTYCIIQSDLNRFAN